MGSVSFFGPQPKFMMANNVSTSSILFFFKRWTPGNTTSDRQFIQAIDPRNRRLKHGYPEISQIIQRGMNSMFGCNVSATDIRTFTTSIVHESDNRLGIKLIVIKCILRQLH